MCDSSMQEWTHNERIDSNHTPNAAINSVEYCTVPNSNHMIDWCVFIGFEVGDTQNSKAHTSIKNTCKRTKREFNLLLHKEEFQAWFEMHYIFSLHYEKMSHTILLPSVQFQLVYHFKQQKGP
jgi:hypothetical protein